MTVQFSQIEISEPRLFSDSYNQPRSNNSFEEKLKLEQARLGLFFSPFAQMEALFSSTVYGKLDTSSLASETNLYSLSEQPQQTIEEQTAQNNSLSPTPHPSSQLSGSVPLQSPSRQFLQQLLTQTGWLVPNLEAQPLFYQAYTEGKLQPKLDLQALIDQIAEQVNLVKEKGRTELSLTLKPRELGNILLTLTYHAGIVSIQISASAETKKLLDAQQEELERALKKANVTFDKIEVSEEVKTC